MMDKETTQLIEKLAETLGTTSEYIWEVLIKQAPVYAAGTILEIILMIIFGCILFVLHLYFSKESDNSRSKYDKYDALIRVPMFIGAIFWFCLALVAFFSISHIITALVNPEYWALKQILNAL